MFLIRPQTILVFSGLLLAGCASTEPEVREQKIDTSEYDEFRKVAKQKLKQEPLNKPDDSRRCEKAKYDLEQATNSGQSAQVRANKALIQLICKDK